MNEILRLRVNIDEVARQLGTAADIIEKQVVDTVKKISISAHAFIVNKANSELEGTKREMYLGIGKFGDKSERASDSQPGVSPRYKNVRWLKLADGIWVVEVDHSAAWLEEGRPETDMATAEWLLKPGKVKTAKDGSTYRSIPIGKMKGNKPSFDTGILGEGPGGAVLTEVKKAARKAMVSLHKLEYDSPNNPKIGVLHKLSVKEPFSRLDHPEWFSKPREAGSREAVESGLKPYKGAFHMQGAVVMQRKNDKGVVKKETVVFRTVSSKHKGHRWMYPAQAPLGFVKAAHEFAEQQWDEAVKAIDAQLKGL